MGNRDLDSVNVSIEGEQPVFGNLPRKPYTNGKLTYVSVKKFLCMYNHLDNLTVCSEMQNTQPYSNSRYFL